MNFLHNNLKYLNRLWALKIVSLKRLFLVCRFLYFIIRKIVVILFVRFFVLINLFLLKMQAFLVDETCPSRNMRYWLILHIFLPFLLKFLTYRFLPCFLIYIIKHCRLMLLLSNLVFCLFFIHFMSIFVIRYFIGNSRYE